MGWTFLWFGLGNILLSLILSRILSRRLVRNIERAAKKVRAIRDTSDLRGRVSLKGHDEVAFLTGEFDRLLDKLEESQGKLVEAELVQTKIQIAREVAHNIRSPILAMDAMLKYMIRVPEGIRKSMRSSIDEIMALSEKFKKQADELAGIESKAMTSVVFLPFVIQEVVAKKNLELSTRKGFDVQFERGDDSTNAFVHVDALEFKSILSNLINNAIDSYPEGTGSVLVSLSTLDGECTLTVADHGAGIPEEFVKQIGRIAITFKGSDSRGVGLVHAFKVIESWGGRVEIMSTLGKGTIVSIYLPDCGHMNNLKHKELAVSYKFAREKENGLF
jgi:signal transduction histidine kinase